MEVLSHGLLPLRQPWCTTAPSLTPHPACNPPNPETKLARMSAFCLLTGGVFHCATQPLHPGVFWEWSGKPPGSSVKNATGGMQMTVPGPAKGIERKKTKFSQIKTVMPQTLLSLRTEFQKHPRKRTPFRRDTPPPFIRVLFCAGAPLLSLGPSPSMGGGILDRSPTPELTFTPFNKPFMV